MKFIPLRSSMLIGVGYDPDQQLLVAQFDPDTFYSYSNVPPEKVVRVLFAESHGQEFTRLIKNAPDEHPYRKLTKEEIEVL